MDTLLAASNDRLEELISVIVGNPTDDLRVYTLAIALGENGIVIGSRRSATFLASSACAWIMSKASGVALIVSGGWSGAAAYREPVERQRFETRLQREENARRDRMTPEVCALVLMAFTESRWIFARDLMRGAGATYLTENLFADGSHPSYTEMRNWLIVECDAPYTLACRAAFARVESNIRLMRQSWRAVTEAWQGPHAEPGERGWL
jgi:hypothetical protein